MGWGWGWGWGLGSGVGSGTSCCLLFNYVCHGCHENYLQCLQHPTHRQSASPPGCVVNFNSTWVSKSSMAISLTSSPSSLCSQLPVQSSLPPQGFLPPRLLLLLACLAKLLGSFMCFVFTVACRINGIIYNLFLPGPELPKWELGNGELGNGEPGNGKREPSDGICFSCLLFCYSKCLHYRLLNILKMHSILKTHRNPQVQDPH